MQKSSNVVVEQLIKQYHDKRLGHAFLIETNHQEQCLTDLISFLKVINCKENYEDSCTKCNLCHLIDTFQLPNFIVIRPDGQTIKKEQINNLKKSFQTKPFYSTYNMYVILNAELLNASSANTMLKFLEEPEEHILGIFITNNKENMIDTIKSRCQIFSNFYPLYDTELIPEKWVSFAVNFVKEYELVHEETILYNKNVLVPEMQEKEDKVFFFRMVLDLYRSLYLAKVKKQPLKEEYQELQFLLKKEASYFLTQMQYVQKILEEIQYYVNVQLLMDRFVLESRV